MTQKSQNNKCHVLYNTLHLFKITFKSWKVYFSIKIMKGYWLSSLMPGCDLLGYDMLVTVISLETLTDRFRRPADMSRSHETITIVYLPEGNFGPENLIFMNIVRIEC